MENNLIPYVEFVGLPGSGKSYFSHKVAEVLRAGGYKIEEPSWVLDHEYGKWSRVFRKIWMSVQFRLSNRDKAVRLIKSIRICRLVRDDEKRIVRNLLYKAHLLTKQNKCILFFDEGIAQMAVSMAVGSGNPAQQIYNDLIEILSFEHNGVVVRIDCDIETALLNMDQRKSRDSKAEKIEGLEAKKEYLTKYKKECESLVTNNMVAIPFSYQGEEVVARIINEIKSRI